jgi:hypothetical protein
MNLKSNLKISGFVLIIFIFGCVSPLNLPTPEKIGEKERVREITGKQAAQVVDKMHGRSIATNANVIAEYGRDDLMIEKMAAAKNGPFFHLMPLGQYDNKVYMTLGMGAMHYIYLSGKSLLWLQTYQSFGDKLPSRLLELYPI